MAEPVDTAIRVLAHRGPTWRAPLVIDVLRSLPIMRQVRAALTPLLPGGLVSDLSVTSLCNVFWHHMGQPTPCAQSDNAPLTSRCIRIHNICRLTEQMSLKYALHCALCIVCAVLQSQYCAARDVPLAILAAKLLT